MQFPTAASFKSRRPQKQGMGGQGHVLPHTLVLHRCARELLLALCKGHSAASSYRSQPTDTQHGDPTGTLSAWKRRWEQERPSVWVCTVGFKWGCRETAAKTNKLPPARRHPKDACQALHQLWARAMQSCPRCTRILEDRGKCDHSGVDWGRGEGAQARGEPRISGLASQGGPRGFSGEQPHPAQPEPGELHATAVLASKLQAARGRNKSKTKHLSKSPFPVARTVMQYFQNHGLCGSGGQFHALTPAWWILQFVKETHQSSAVIFNAQSLHKLLHFADPPISNHLKLLLLLQLCS